MPAPETMLEFEHYCRSMRVSFVVYADFESLIKPMYTCQPDPSKSYRNAYQKHTPSSFCYYVKCFDDKVYSGKPITFTIENENDDVADIFVRKLEEHTKDIYQRFFKYPMPMVITAFDKKKYKEATICHICEKDLDNDRARDHCHLTRIF